MKKIRQSYIDGIDQRKRQLDEDDNAQVKIFKKF